MAQNFLPMGRFASELGGAVGRIGARLWGTIWVAAERGEAVLGTNVGCTGCRSPPFLWAHGISEKRTDTRLAPNFSQGESGRSPSEEGD